MKEIKEKEPDIFEKYKEIISNFDFACNGFQEYKKFLEQTKPPYVIYSGLVIT